MVILSFYIFKIFLFNIIEKLAEATRKYAALQNELKTAMELQQGGGKKGKVANVKAQLPTRKIRELKLAFSEYYLSLILLQNYQNLNYTGFRKILKKHDKVYMQRNQKKIDFKLFLIQNNSLDKHSPDVLQVNPIILICRFILL